MGNFLLGYNLVIKPAKSCDLPSSLSSRLLLNQMIASGVGLAPLVGDISACWLAASRSNRLSQRCLQAEQPK